MLNYPMPFPRVPIIFYLPTETGPDAYGNVQLSYSDENTVTCEGCYAPRDPADDIEDGRPYGETVKLRLYLPKTFSSDIRNAKVKLQSGDALIDADEYIVIGDPVSYMRDATPGDMSWYVEVADYAG